MDAVNLDEPRTTCAQCGDRLPTRSTNMGPAPVYCGIPCRRAREKAVARARRARQRDAYAAAVAAELAGWDGAA